MERKKFTKLFSLVGAFLAVWLFGHYLFPLMFPFLLGFIIAFISEPGVKFLQNKIHLSRFLSCVLAVSLELMLLFGLLWLLFALGYRELSALAEEIPGMARELTGHISEIRQWLLERVNRFPVGLQPVLTRTVSDLFTSGSVLLKEGTAGAVSFLGGLIGGIPGSALTLGTAVVSGYMISMQLPVLRKKFFEGTIWNQNLKPILFHLRETVGKWLIAQVKLSGITFCIVTVGLLLLRTDDVIIWSVLIALVDAVPMLGTGTVLIPWAVICLLRGNSVKALGLAGIYVTAMLVRSAAEPKLVGKQLGLNPLITLIALYAGFRLWGVVGMILAPILAVSVNQLTNSENTDLQG